MKSLKLLALTLLVLMTFVSHGQQLKSGTVYSYMKDGVRYYSSTPPPGDDLNERRINYSFVEVSGTWAEKSGGAIYVFDDGFDFEYRNNRVVKKGVWQMAAGSCAVGLSKGNLYIQAGTERCCYSATFLGNNLVLTALTNPAHQGVCSDRVLIQRQPSP